MACVNGFCTNQGCDNCTAKYTAPQDATSATVFTDYPVSANNENIKAIHVNELRAALDAEVSRRGGVDCGIGGWASVTAVVDDVEAQHFTDLKTCNNNLTYYPLDGDLLDSVADVYSVGVLIYASELNNLMAAVNANEVRCTCNSDCGADDCFCACFGDCESCNYP